MIDEAQKAIGYARHINDDILIWDAYRLLHGAFVGINQREEATYVIALMQPLTERLDDQRRIISFALLQIQDLYIEAPAQLIEGVQAILAQAQELGDPILEAACWSVLAKLHLRASDLPSALEASQQQLRLSRQIGDRRQEGWTLNQIGLILVNLGQLSEGNAFLLDGYKLMRQIGERAGEAMSFLYLGIIAEHHKAYDEALAYMNRGLAIQRELDVDAEAALTLFHMANVFIAKGDLEEARHALIEARAFLQATNLVQQIEEIDAALAEVHLRQENLSTASRHIEPLLSRLQHDVNDLIVPGLAYWRTIQVLKQCGQAEEAARLRDAFRVRANSIMSRLDSPKARDRYVNSIWYHAALLTD